MGGIDVDIRAKELAVCKFSDSIPLHFISKFPRLPEKQYTEGIIPAATTGKMQPPVAPQARAYREVGDLPRYNEILVDHEVSVTSSTFTSPRRRPAYTTTPTVYSISGSSLSDYSQYNNDQDSPATSVERSSDLVSEGTMANLDSMLISRNTSTSRPRHVKSVDVMTDRMAHRELVAFLRTSEPPPESLKSVPENSEDISRKPSFKIFARKSAGRRKSPRVVRLPETAVAATTTLGHKHIAISLPKDYDNPELKSQYQYHAPVKVLEPQPKTPQKLQKQPARVAGSAKPLTKTGAVAVKKPTFEGNTAPPPTRNASVHVNVEQSSWPVELPTTAQSSSLAQRARSPVVGAENAQLLQRFWEQHPPMENGNAQLKAPAKALGSPGSMGTDPRHSGGTAYSERTLGTATASAGHSREASGNSNSSNQPSGSRPSTGNHPPRSSSKTPDSNPTPTTPRTFSQKPPTSSNGRSRSTTIGSSENSPSRAAIPSEVHNGDSDLISLSGFLAACSPKPPQPGPAPNRKLPDLPEGNDVCRHCSSSSNKRPELPAELPALPSPISPRSLPKSAASNASPRREAHAPDHPVNRPTDEDAGPSSPRTARQVRQDRVRAKKQRDLAHLKAANIAQAQSVAPNSGESSQQQAVNGDPTASTETVIPKGSVRAARKRSEGQLRPPPLDLSKMDPPPKLPTLEPSAITTGTRDRSQTMKNLPATDVGSSNGNGLPAGSFGSGNGKGSVRHARKRSESLMSPGLKTDASTETSALLRNPSLRAAANALVMLVAAETEPPVPAIKNFSYLLPAVPNQATGSKAVNGFPLPPRSPRRLDPNLAQGSARVGGNQTPPRSPSPSLQSSDEEGSLKNGHTAIGISRNFPLISSQKSPAKSTSVATNGKKVFEATTSTQQPSSSHSRQSSSNTVYHDTNPPPSSSTDSKESQLQSLTAAITAFELQRQNRRKERNRTIRERRARDSLINRERTTQETLISQRLENSESRHSAMEERIRRIEENNCDLVRRFDDMVRFVREFEGDRSRFSSSTSREFNLVSPVVGRQGSRGMRIDISMPPSASGSVVKGRESIDQRSLFLLGEGQRRHFAFEGDEEEEEEEPPGYDAVGGRSKTPIGSLIEELEAESEGGSSLRAVVGRRSGKEKEKEKEKGKRKELSLGKGKALGGLGQGLYDGSGWGSGEPSPNKWVGMDEVEE